MVSTDQPLTAHNLQVRFDGTARASTTTERGWEESMLSVHIETIGEMAIIECEGRIVRSDAAYKLREAVRSQIDARIIVLDLSEVPTIEGGGLGMLVFLQHWAHDHDIRLKLFNPRQSVRERLERVTFMREFDLATLDEMMALLALADGRHYARAA
jgi:anti-anti-sigma regulatory factor